MIVIEYYCTRLDCGEHFKPVERFIHVEDIDDQICERCQGNLFRCLSATKGYVKGSENPVKQ